MNAVLQDIIETGQTSSPEGERVQVHSEITRAEGEFLQRIIRSLRPRTTLEIGLAFGVSALFICEALREVGGDRHIVIDPNQFDGPWGDPWRGVGLANLQRAGFEDLVELVCEPSYRALPRLEERGLGVDFAFVDGWHTFDYALLDFFYIDLILRVGGVVVFDDASWPALRKLIRYVMRNRHYGVLGKVGVPGGGRGLAGWKGLARALLAGEFGSSCVALCKEAQDDRAWDFHVRF